MNRALSSTIFTQWGVLFEIIFTHPLTFTKLCVIIILWVGDKYYDE